MNHFQSLRDYEEYVYGLPQRVATITYSTLVLARIGARIATLRGELHFHGNYRLTLSERLSLEEDGLLLIRYGYEVWRGEEKLYWYDPQPHPNEPSLQSTHPHHKHVPPNIKHHRIPAPGLSFNQPNLPFLLEEIERDLLTSAPPAN